MTKAIDIMTAHYERLRGQSFEVKELSTEKEPFMIYHDAPSPEMGQKIAARAGNVDANTILYALIFMAKKSDGTPLFEDDAATVEALTKNVDAELRTRIAMRMLKGSDVVDLKKP